MKIHSIENNGQIIKCELKKRTNSKFIKMFIDSNGIVRVSLPYHSSYYSAKTFIYKNLDWIEKKLDHFRLQKNKYYYLGNNIRVIKKYNANNKYFNYIKNEYQLVVETNDLNSSKDDLFIEFIRQKALEYIPNRVEEYAKKFGFRYNRVNIKKLTAQWGSCSAKKNLSFNLKLMYFNRKVIDYVIVHELCHLKEMNHSNKFWKLVSQIIPNYEIYKNQLGK